MRSTPPTTLPTISPAEQTEVRNQMRSHFPFLHSIFDARANAQIAEQKVIKDRLPFKQIRSRL